MNRIVAKVKICDFQIKVIFLRVFDCEVSKQERLGKGALYEFTADVM